MKHLKREKLGTFGCVLCGMTCGRRQVHLQFCLTYEASARRC